MNKIETSAKIDLCVLCDTTSSMGGEISSAQEHLKSVVDAIHRQNNDLRVAAIEYKDHCDNEVMTVQPFSSNVDHVKEAIDCWTASGGGDMPEAMADGLHAALQLVWRDDATKLLILIADAPCHGIGHVGEYGVDTTGDTLPDGCPNGYDPFQLVHQLAKKDVILYTVGCRVNGITKALLATIATIGGGRYIEMRNAEALPVILVGSAEEETALQRFHEEMNAARETVLHHMAQEGEEVVDDVVFARVARMLADRGVHVSRPIGTDDPDPLFDALVAQLTSAQKTRDFSQAFAQKQETIEKQRKLREAAQSAERERERALSCLARHFDICDLPLQFGKLPPQPYRARYRRADELDMSDTAARVLRNVDDIPCTQVNGIRYEQLPITFEQVKRSLMRKALQNE